MNTKSITPQSKIIADHLRKHGSITAVEAAAVYKVRSLSRRISELSNEFQFLIEKEHKRDATGQRYVRYSMEPGQRACGCSICKDVEGAVAA